MRDLFGPLEPARDSTQTTKGMELLQMSFIPFIVFISVRDGALRKLLVKRVLLGNWRLSGE